MSWVLYSLSCLLAITGFSVLNQHFKINSTILMLYRGIGTAIVALPLMLLTHFQPNPVFYIYIVIMGCIIAYLDNSTQNGIARFGGGPLSRARPLYLVVSMIIWWMIAPSSFIALLENQQKLIGVLSAMLLVVISLFFFKNDRISKKLFKYCVGIYICSILIDICGKSMFLTSDGTTSAVIHYIFFSSLIAGLINLVYFAYKNGFSKETFKPVFESNTLTAGVLIIGFIILSMFFRNKAIIMVDNPAYVSTITSLTPLIIVMYNKLVNFTDKTNKIAGLVMVLGCIMLSYFAS